MKDTAKNEDSISATKSKDGSTSVKSTLFSSNQTKILHFLTLSGHERSENALAYNGIIWPAMLTAEVSLAHPQSACIE